MNGGGAGFGNGFVPLTKPGPALLFSSELCRQTPVRPPPGASSPRIRHTRLRLRCTAPKPASGSVKKIPYEASQALQSDDRTSPLLIPSQFMGPSETGHLP